MTTELTYYSPVDFDNEALVALETYEAGHGKVPVGKVPVVTRRLAARIAAEIDKAAAEYADSNEVLNRHADDQPDTKTLEHWVRQLQPELEEVIADSLLTTTHPQVTIFVMAPAPEGARAIEVDEELAQLITVMNAAGFQTLLSCQDNDRGRGNVRRVWVEIFADDLPRLLAILNRPEEVDDYESLSCRIASEYEPEDWADYRANRCWHYDLEVGRFDGEIEDLGVSVRFLYSDLDEVVSRLRAALPLAASPA